MPKTKGAINRVAIVALVSVLAVGVLSQLIVPRFIESKIESRMTANGGSAEASLEARPAVGLIFGSAQKLVITANGVTLDEPDRDQAKALRRLDSVDQVEIRIDQSIAGPMRIDSFVMRREDPDQPYTLEMSGSTTATDLASYGAERLGLPPVLDQIASAFEAGRTKVPIELGLEVISRDGRLAVSDGEATVAGVPTGPLVELVLAAVVARI